MRKLLLVSIAASLFACDKPEPNVPLIKPYFVKAEAVQLDETTGEVEVTATAEAVNFFTFVFYEDNDSTIIESAEGMASYTYKASGDYTIKVNAHATYDEFTSITKDISVEIIPEFTGGIPTTGYSTPMSYAGYQLVWNDEFDGNQLSNDWTQEIGNGQGGWGNQELQYYRAENTTVEDGLLKITAKQEFFGGFNYTSSRIKTQGKQFFTYGRIDIRAALPYGKGLWPALWMLGESFSSVGWPACGEIDIMEMVGGMPNGDNTVHGTVHWSNNGSHANFGGSRKLSSGILAENFHVFSIIWDETSIVWYIDDVQYHTIDITPAELSEFHSDFFFIFNVAVGGVWPGSPNSTTVFPQTMAVDYVRVFQSL